MWTKNIHLAKTCLRYFQVFIPSELSAHPTLGSYNFAKELILPMTVAETHESATDSTDNSSSATDKYQC